MDKRHALVYMDVCYEAGQVSRIPQCDFGFNLDFDLLLFRKMITKACERARDTLTELRVQRLTKPNSSIKLRPGLESKFESFKANLSRFSIEIENEKVIERNELRNFREILYMLEQMAISVRLLFCYLSQSVKIKDTVLFAAPITDAMSVMAAVMESIDKLAKRPSSISVKTGNYPGWSHQKEVERAHELFLIMQKEWGYPSDDEDEFDEELSEIDEGEFDTDEEDKATPVGGTHPIKKSNKSTGHKSKSRANKDADQRSANEGRKKRSSHRSGRRRRRRRGTTGRHHRRRKRREAHKGRTEDTSNDGSSRNSSKEMSNKSSKKDRRDRRHNRNHSTK
ncbi:hypothetical protein ACOME3_009352 [Neoechinorhynchus agilis]